MLIDQRQDPERTAYLEPIRGNIHRLPLIGTGCRWGRGADAGRTLAALSTLHAQIFLSVEPVDQVVAVLQAFATVQPKQPAIPITHAQACQFPRSLAHRRVVTRLA